MRHSLLTPALVVAVAACGPTEASNPIDTSAAKSEVLAVVATFASALETGDEAAALDALHPDVVVYEAGHVESSREEFAADHLAADIEFMVNVTKIGAEPQVIVSSAGDMALAISEYRLEGTYNDDEVNRNGTETKALVNTPEGWKIRHIHWSSHTPN